MIPIEIIRDEHDDAIAVLLYNSTRACFPMLRFAFPRNPSPTPLPKKKKKKEGRKENTNTRLPKKEKERIGNTQRG